MCDAPAAPVAPIPGSLSDACAQARAAVSSCVELGKTRMFVEIDTTNGDETYTLLKNSLPVVKLVAPGLLREDNEEARVHVLLPDSGAAALLRRDWDVPEGVSVAGLEDINVNASDAGLVIVAPRASEVDKLQAAVEAAGALPVVVVCPDLVDMGVTGLSLNARQLRERLINTFEEAYFLRTYHWGVIIRQHPGEWGVWVDAPGTPVGFRLVAQRAARPSSDDIGEILDDIDGGPKQGVIQGMVSAFSRFLRVYSKG